MSDFQLIETMRFETGPVFKQDMGIVRLRLHLERLKRSANRLGFRGAERAKEALDAALGISATPFPMLRVRLTLASDGTIEITTAPFTPLHPDTVWRLRIARTRLDSADRLLRVKTTRRTVYEAARAEFSQAEADEVILVNESEAVCEGTITSIFLDDGTGLLKTPPISCGLLAGVLRTELICRRSARIQRLSLADLAKGRIYVGNSLRGLIPAVLSHES